MRCHDVVEVRDGGIVSDPTSALDRRASSWQRVDILARLIAQQLSERLGQPFIVEARPGAGGNLGAEAVVRAAPDGHTLLVITSTNSINTVLYDNLGFNFLRDITAIGTVTLTAYALVVNPSLSSTSLPEFIAYAKANPGKLNIASGGNGRRLSWVL